MALRFVLLAALLPGLFGCSAGAACDGPAAANPCSRVLFIGNSFTYENDLPATFTALAQSGGHRVVTAMLADGGATLADHVASADTAATLTGSRWDVVVLQEQSEIPSVAQFRQQQMYPAARSLVQQVEAVRARPMLFMTWAHQAGWPENGLPGFAAMQDQIDLGYRTIAVELGVPMAPVGPAWLELAHASPALSLFQADGVHPNAAGTYLAACVFYLTLFRQSPEGLAAPDGVPSDVALILQRAAAVTVLGNPAEWNLAD